MLSWRSFQLMNDLNNTTLNLFMIHFFELCNETDKQKNTRECKENQEYNNRIYTALSDAFSSLGPASGQAGAKFRVVYLACGSIEIYFMGTYMVKF